MQEHRLALPCGYQLDHFRIESVLGKGGFGITYLAMDLRLGKRVAIKELLPDSIATRVEGYTVVPQSSSLADNWQWARERFLEEARVLAGFSHPAIVGVHLLMEAHGTVYMVMDYLEGESYEARLKRIGREPDQGALMSVMGPILNGLEEVHAKGLTHRDIKPENILITSRGQPVLIDFGSARQSLGKTMTMTSIVTHGYSPIEQYQTKGRMGPWTDIYAMGAVMCRAMTGEKPPVAADRLMEDDFAWLSYRSLSGYSDEFRQSVDWGLRVKPEERPQTVRQWATQLNQQGVPGQLPAATSLYTAPSPPLPAEHNPQSAALRSATVFTESNNDRHEVRKPLTAVIVLAALVIAMAVLAIAVGVISPLLRGSSPNASSVGSAQQTAPTLHGDLDRQAHADLQAAPLPTQKHAEASPDIQGPGQSAASLAASESRADLLPPQHEEESQVFLAEQNEAAATAVNAAFASLQLLINEENKANKILEINRDGFANDALTTIQAEMSRYGGVAAENVQLLNEMIAQGSAAAVAKALHEREDQLLKALETTPDEKTAEVAKRAFTSLMQQIQLP